jgi:hypothetical protein
LDSAQFRSINIKRNSHTLTVKYDGFCQITRGFLPMPESWTPCRWGLFDLGVSASCQRDALDTWRKSPRFNHEND